MLSNYLYFPLIAFHLLKYDISVKHLAFLYSRNALHHQLNTANARQLMKPSTSPHSGVSEPINRKSSATDSNNELTRRSVLAMLLPRAQHTGVVCLWCGVCSVDTLSKNDVQYIDVYTHGLWIAVHTSP